MISVSCEQLHTVMILCQHSFVPVSCKQDLKFPEIAGNRAQVTSVILDNSFTDELLEEAKKQTDLL